MFQKPRPGERIKVKGWGVGRRCLQVSFVVKHGIENNHAAALPIACDIEDPEAAASYVISIASAYSDLVIVGTCFHRCLTLALHLALDQARYCSSR